MAEHEPEVEPSEHAPGRVPRPLAFDLRLRRLDETSIRDAGRTHRLAGPTVQTQREVLGGGVRESDATLRERLDEKDPAAR